MSDLTGTTTEPAELTIETKGTAALITLSRPRTLNALTDKMRADLAAAFPRFARTPELYAVIMRSSVPKAFSVGADVREVIEIARRDKALARKSFAGEYRLNWLLECFSKPTVSLINGMVMGGGVGISQYGTHRVGGELYRFAMPETAIGFFPDIGMAHVLARLPNEIGTYLGLTARTIGRADAYHLGLLTHCIPAERFPEIEEGLADTQPVDPLLDSRHEDPGEAPLAGHAGFIGWWFSSNKMEEIMRRLSTATGPMSELAASIKADLEKRSPLALKITLRHLREARKLDLRETLEADYRLVWRFVEEPDFAEGVRAALIDKGSKPQWRHSSIEEVTSEEVDRFFAPLGADELNLPSREEMQAARV